MNSKSPCALNDQPEKEREREGEKERERMTRGDQATSVSKAQQLYFLKVIYIACLIHRGK